VNRCLPSAAPAQGRLLFTPRAGNRYFPYHHSPLLVDVAALLSLDPAAGSAAWAPSVPLRPFEQLLSVLPASGARHLPPPHAQLLLAACDPAGGHPLRPHYPRDYIIEKDPKGRPWRDLALLPFLDVAALLDAVAALPPPPPADAARNRHGLAYAFAFDGSQRGELAPPAAFAGRLPPLAPARSVALRMSGAPPRGQARTWGARQPSGSRGARLFSCVLTLAGAAVRRRGGRRCDAAARLARAGDAAALHHVPPRRGL